MRYGVFGGTFDPFHEGHLSMIIGALQSGNVDHVYVIPSGYPPKKDAYLVTPAIYRYYMTRAALKGVSGCEVLSIELQKSSPSYTVHTLEALRREGKVGSKDEIVLIYGSDILFEIETWYHPEILFREAKFLLASRPGVMKSDTLDRVKELEKKYQMSFSFFPIEEHMASSREIRRNRSFGDVSEPVRRFIHKHALYPEDNPLRHLSDETHEKIFTFTTTLITELSQQRLLHSMNTAVLSVRYAILFGEDPDDAAIAGLLHDCAKELPIRQQKDLASRCESPDMSLDNATIHAPAGETYARERYGIESPSILSAIRYHTTGREEMTRLEKIVYLADKLEPARDYADLGPLRERADYDLDGAVMFCLVAVAESVERRKTALHPESERAMRFLQSKSARSIIREAVQTTKEEKMDLLTVAQKIVSILNDKKGKDVELIPVAEKTALAEYFVICSGTSVTHIKALSDEVEFCLKNELGIMPDHIEGLSTGRWVLLDYKDIVVHVFHPEERAHYSLEKLWLNKRPEHLADIEESVLSNEQDPQEDSDEE